MITETFSGKYRIIRHTGRLDTHTAPKFEEYIKKNITPDEPKSLVFDFNDLEFISSAGLRICVLTLKIITEKDSSKELTVLCKKDSAIYDPFEMTGLDATFNIIEKL